MTAATGGDLGAADDGEVLMAELHGLLSRLDPPPLELLDQVRRAFCWRTVDSELAELSFDSLVDHDLALAVRSAGDATLEPRLLGFGAVVDGEDLAIEIEVSGSPAGPSLVGQLWPPGAGTVEVQTGAGGVAAVPVDDLGRFLVEAVPAGPVRLSVPHRGRLVHTTWVSYTGV